MSDLLPPSIAITIATVETPPADAETAPDRHLVGVALFEAEEHAPGAFLYRYGARVIPASSREAILIDWLNGCLPEGRTMIGWRLAEDIVPALLEASQAAVPQDARIFIDALAALIGIDAVDLADQVERPATFGALCVKRAIPCSSLHEDQVMAAWTLDREVELLGHLATNAVASWRCWAEAMRPDDPVVRSSAQAMLATWIGEQGATVQYYENEEGP